MGGDARGRVSVSPQQSPGLQTQMARTPLLIQKVRCIQTNRIPPGAWTVHTLYSIPDSGIPQANATLHQDRIYSQPSISFHQIIMIYSIVGSFIDSNYCLEFYGRMPAIPSQCSIQKVIKNAIVVPGLKHCKVNTNF